MTEEKKSPLVGYAILGSVALFAVLAFASYKPKPGPGPGPGPVPPPLDPSGSFLVFVTDNENRTPEQAQLLDSDELWKWLGERKIGWRTIDKGAQVYLDQGYDRLLSADGVQPACVVLWAPGNAAHKTAPFPSGVEQLKQWIVGSPHTGPPTYDDEGELRLLTRLPPSEAKLMAPRGGEFSKEVQAPIPRSQWREVDNRAKFPPGDWIYDQDGIGACVGNGGTSALRKIRLMAGMSDQRLAPGCTYSQINGGHDNGAVISDSLTALQQTGTITAKTLGSDQKPFYSRQMPSGWKDEAKRFRIEEAYHCATYDDMCTAVQLGYVIVYGMQVGNSFGKFDKDGVAGHASGVGNHCMHADGLKKLPSGKWVLDNINSWGAEWGPWKNGRCYLDEDHFLHGCQPDAYAVKVAVEDPLEPKKPPKPKAEEEQELQISIDAVVKAVQDAAKAAVPPPGVKRAKTCLCSSACVCGCNDGRGCDCGEAKPAAIQGWAPTPATYYAPAPAPARGGC